MDDNQKLIELKDAMSRMDKIARVNEEKKYQAKMNANYAGQLMPAPPMKDPYLTLDPELHRKTALARGLLSAVESLMSGTFHCGYCPSDEFEHVTLRAKELLEKMDRARLLLAEIEKL